MTDAQAVERARGGDHDAFRVLVERYQDRVYRLARRILRDDEWARDAAQEAFLKVYRAIPATSAAVRRWMSSPFPNASIRLASLE